MARDEDRERKRRLNKMMKDLQKVDPADILAHLTCLSDMRKEQIRRIWKNDGAMIAAGELFEELPKRENWYSTLVTALREIDRDDLADKLEGPEKKSPPSGSSESVATVQTSHNASVTQNQGAQQSPPAANPHPPARQERSPEPEASVSAGLPDIATEKDAPQKGAEKDTKPSGPVENSGQQSQAGASLPMPVQERRQTSASDLAPGESGSGGTAASSPSSDQQRHIRSEADQYNISPPTPMQAKETAAIKPGNPSRESGSGGLAASSPSSDQQRHDRSESDEYNISPPTPMQAKETAAIKPGNPSRESGSGGPAASSPSSDEQRHGRSESDQYNISPPTPMQAETAATKPNLESRESGSGGPAASSPSSGQRRHGESESDECNISSNGRPTRLQAEETAAVKPGNPSPTAASGGRVSVRPRDDRQTGRENTVGRMEGEVESGGERERKESREEGRDKENLNFQNYHKNLNTQKVKDPPRDKMNNLSPSKDVQELYWKKENKNNLQSRNVGEDRDDVCLSEGIHSLSSVNTVTRESRLVSNVRYSELAISRDPASSQGGSHSQQTKEGRGVQGAEEGRGVQGAEEGRGVQGVEEGRGVQGAEEGRGVQGVEEGRGVQGVEEGRGVQGAEEGRGVQGAEEGRGVQGAEEGRGVQGAEEGRGVQGAEEGRGVQGAEEGRGVQGAEEGRGVQGAEEGRGVQGAEEGRGVQGAEEGRGVQGVEEGRGVQGAEEGGNRNEVGDAGGIDVGTDNQDSLIMRYGNVFRGYIPGMLNAFSRHMLNQ